PSDQRDVSQQTQNLHRGILWVPSGQKAGGLLFRSEGPPVSFVALTGLILADPAVRVQRSAIRKAGERGSKILQNIETKG
ncbi:MAG: hypothetical protein ACREBW_00530, partial [Candidatus Micrarchaeaceae archaeon]